RTASTARRARPRAVRGAAHGAVRTRAPAHPAAARVRTRGVRAPAAPRPPLRRRPHGVLPLLLAARCRRAASAGALPPDGGLVRGMEPLLLARLSRPRGGRDRLPGAAALRAPAPARLLLLAPARRAPARAGPARA